MPLKRKSIVSEFPTVTQIEQIIETESEPTDVGGEAFIRKYIDRGVGWFKELFWRLKNMGDTDVAFEIGNALSLPEFNHLAPALNAASRQYWKEALNKKADDFDFDRDWKGETDDIDVGFSILVDVMNQDWDDLEASGYSNDDVNYAMGIIEKNIINNLESKGWVTWIRDEGHGGYVGELVGSASITTDILQSIIDNWNNIADGTYALQTQDGSIWFALEEKDVFKGIESDIQEYMNIEVEFFEVPDDIFDGKKSKKAMDDGSGECPIKTMLEDLVLMHEYTGDDEAEILGLLIDIFSDKEISDIESVVDGYFNQI